MNLAGTIQRTRIGLRLAAVFALGCGVTAGALIPQAVYAAETQDEALTRLGEVYDTLKNNHVSGVTDEKLTDAAIQGMIASLKDPYTVYFTKEQYALFNNELGMVYVGIGAKLSQDEKGTRIVEVFAGSPAEEAGLVSGDYIQEVNGKSMMGLSLENITGVVKGPEGTGVSITLLRKDDKLSTIQLTRRAISVPSVVSQVLDDGSGYMQVTGFTDTTDELFAAQLEQLKKKSISRLIVDLRDNPGGVLETAQHIAEQFIPEGTLIHTKDRNGVDSPVLLKGGNTVAVPVVFLVNESSASASEVLSGALQDYGKAKIVGTLTYGKGSVQSIVMLSSGAAVKVTIEQYFTPKGKPVNHVGITPDVQVEGATPQFITALREAGSAALNVKMDKDNVKVNGLAMADKLVPLQLSGRLYVPARLLASMVGGKIVWNDQQQAIEIATGTTSVDGATTAGSNATVSYGADSGMINRDGVGLIDVAEFQKQFAQLTWETSGDQVDLHVQKEAGKESR